MHASSGVETYGAGREWTIAKLPACPLHPSGGCGLARHGNYARAKPSGVRVARWYCPQGHRTFSLSPDFLAARLPGLLAEIEETIFAVACSPSIEAAAAGMRDQGVTLPAAVRWLRRRLGPVQRAVQALRDTDTDVALVIDAGFLACLYALLLFLYNCGARVSEAAGLRWDNLQLAAPRQVRLRGKRKKERVLPLWPETVNALHRLRGMSRGANGLCVFVNRNRQPLTRDGIAYILTKYATAAAHDNPELLQKHITPHVLRHSCAVALLQSGTDVTVIRDYLGHTSVATTGRDITINLQMKRDAMQAF